MLILLYYLICEVEIQYEGQYKKKLKKDNLILVVDFVIHLGS